MNIRNLLPFDNFDEHSEERISYYLQDTLGRQK